MITRRFAVALAIMACTFILAACDDDGGGQGGRSKGTSATVSPTTTRLDTRAAGLGCKKAGAGAQHLGDNRDCDALAEACAHSDWAACDRLFQASDFGSEYESIGGSCYLTITLDERFAAANLATGSPDASTADNYCVRVVKPRLEALPSTTTTTTA